MQQFPKPSGRRPRVSPTYNVAMTSPLQHQLTPWALERLTLLINHVLASEPAAMDKLRPHAGRSLSVQWTSASGFRPPEWVDRLLPLQNGLPPALAWTITPAGLLEWTPEALPPQETTAIAPPALRLTVALPPPWQLAWEALRGNRPEVQIEGDAQMAETAAWLLKHLRWDLEDDLARWLGAAPTELLRRTAESAREALQRGWGTLRARSHGAPHR